MCHFTQEALPDTPTLAHKLDNNIPRDFCFIALGTQDVITQLLVELKKPFKQGLFLSGYPEHSVGGT